MRLSDYPVPKPRASAAAATSRAPDFPAFDGNPPDGLTVALGVDSQRRGDVLDLARVVEDDAASPRHAAGHS
jgi:hypothetical protein